MQKECSFSSWNHLIPSMPESASAVSHRWVGTQREKGNERKRGKERLYERRQTGGGEKFKGLRHCTKHLKMADVRSQRQFLAPGVRSVTNHVVKAKDATWNVSEALNMAALQLKISWLVDFCSSKLLCSKVLTADWRNFTSGDQKEIHCDKKSRLKKAVTKSKLQQPYRKHAC